MYNYLHNCKRKDRLYESQPPYQTQLYLHVAWRRKCRELGRRNDGDTPLNGDEDDGVDTDEEGTVFEYLVDDTAFSAPPNRPVLVHKSK